MPKIQTSAHTSRPRDTGRGGGISRNSPESVTLTIIGPVPSKKNAWRRRANGKIGLYRETQQLIDSLVTQARIQWGPRLAWGNPDMDVEFHVRNRRADRDNKLSCLLDVLQAARVIHNDNAKWFNGTLVLKPVVIAKEERTVITLTESSGLQLRKLEVRAS